MPTILLTNHYEGKPLRIIRSAVPKDFELVTLDIADQNELLEKCNYADYFLVSGRLKINSNVLNKANKLKMIQRTGVGLDSIDLDCLKSKKIPLYVNKGINADSVAEHTVMLILASLKKLIQVDKNTKNSIWVKQKQGVENRELRGKTVGIIGMGSIGQKVAKMLRGFDVKIIYYDMMDVDLKVNTALQIEKSDLNNLFTNSDIISLHCSLTEQTEHLINRDTVNLMKDGVIVVNTGRGRLIDENALYDGLITEKIAFAALDVFECEPAIDNKLFQLENIITTPHIGGITYDSFYSMMSDAMRNIKLFDEGKYQEIEQYKIRL